MNHIELGKTGEEIAFNYLLNKQYKSLNRNYRFKNAEIDLIFEFNNELIIVEVKTRNSNFFGEPYESVNRKKQTQIIKVANEYIQKFNKNMEVRFDIVSIIKNNKECKIEHIEGVFMP